MGFRYHYDETGLTFYYFLLTFVSLTIVPITLLKFKKLFSENLSKDSSLNSLSASNCECDLCKLKLSKLKAKKVSSGGSGLFGLSKMSIFLVVGWVCIAILLRIIQITEPMKTKLYDPYEILGIETGTSMEDIKKHFKKLSLKFHPDKVAEEDKATAEEKFIGLQKAYQALTDEKIRYNWENYGNPDGISTFDLGIALPTWLVESSNKSWILAMYGLVFGVFLPIFVGKWWNKSKKYTKDGILHYSMALFYRELKDTMDVKKLIEILSASVEFKEELKWQPSDAVEVPQLYNYLRNEIDIVSNESFEKSKRYTAQYCLKAYCLLNAYLWRIPVKNESLAKDQEWVVERSIRLASGMLQIALAKEWLKTAEACMHLFQCLIQTQWDNQSPLLQLPGIVSYDPHASTETPSNCVTLKQLMIKKKKVAVPKNIKELLNLPETTRRNEILSILDPFQYSNLLTVAKSLPSVRIVSVKVRILGQENITCSGLVSVTVSIAPSIMEQRSASAEKLNEIEPNKDAATEEDSNLEIDEDGNIVSESATKKKDEENPALIPNVHSPFFPSERKPGWWILLSVPKANALVAPPVRVLGFAASSSKPKSVTMQFVAPSKPGSVMMCVKVISDSVIGVDLTEDIKFEVITEEQDRLKSAAKSKRKNNNEDDDESDSDSGVETSSSTDAFGFE